MRRLPSWLNWKSLLRWLVVAITALLGFSILVLSARILPSTHAPACYYLPGLTLLGVSLFISSLIAPRNQRLAALVLLIPAPVITFCLAYFWTYSSALESDQDLAILTNPFFTLFVVMLVFLPFYRPLFVRNTRNPRDALQLFAIYAVLSALVLTSPALRPDALLIPLIAKASSFFLLPGLFWFAAHKLNWPLVLTRRPPQSIARRSAKIILTSTAVLLLFTTCLVASALLIPPEQCYSSWYDAPFTEPQGPYHTAFIARVVYLRPETILADYAPRASHSAVGIVEHNFWGVPRWPWHLVFLSGTPLVQGETYFFDMQHSRGLITRFLPFEVNCSCSRTALLRDASLDLHLLNQPPPRLPVLVGEVDHVMERNPPEFGRGGIPYVGATVIVTGSSRSITTTANHQGIYEFDGLVPGNYSVTVSVPKTQYASVESFTISRADPSPVFAVWLPVVWDGTLQGRVTDSTGRPVRTSLQLQRSDKTYVPDRTTRYLFASFRSFTDSRGLFLFDRVQPGNYTIVVNPEGPGPGHPYRRTSSVPIHVAPGQHISHLSLHVAQ